MVSGKRAKKKKNSSFADYIVFLSIIMVTAFTTAGVVLQYQGQMEISPTLTAAWFAFWTAEIVALASIRNTKVKKNYNKRKEEMKDDEDRLEG